jgi:hypothetical protein
MHTELWFISLLENVRLKDREEDGKNNIKIELREVGCELFRMMSNIGI